MRGLSFTYAKHNGTRMLAAALIFLLAQSHLLHSHELNLEESKKSLPHPVLTENANWVELYWKAWEIALGKVRHPKTGNSFVSDYMDEGFSENIFQWDTCFMVMFGRYGYNVVPAAKSFDNFYARQAVNGFIDREIRETDGSYFWGPQSNDSINPPLFSWTEWKSYEITADRERLKRILPFLIKYFNWIKSNRRFDSGLYWSTGFASGMDNSPRAYEKGGTSVHDHYNYSWVDITAQQALNAFYISKIAAEIGDKKTVKQFKKEYDEIKKLVNEKMWDASDGMYYDLDPEGKFAKVKTLASFWTLLAGIADGKQAEALVQHLLNKNEFWDRHVFPTLSRDHPLFSKYGDYWKGSVWAPTNYMVIKGLERNGYEELATKASENHIENMYLVYKETGTIWENYSSHFVMKGKPAMQNFVGWSGAGPVALLIENVIGIRVNAPENSIFWRLTRTDRHGVENLLFNGNRVSLVAWQSNIQEGMVFVRAEAEKSFTLWVQTTPQKEPHKITIPDGKNIFAVKIEVND